MRLRTKYTQRLPVAPGLRLDIPFFEGSGTKVLDVSGKGNHGTITDALWTRDENGVAMSFNGTSVYIDCGNDASLNPTDAITIEAWVKPLSKASYHYIIQKREATKGFYLMYEESADQKVYFIVKIGGASKTSITNDVLPLNVWTHLVGTYDGSRVRIYENGIEQTYGTNTTGSIGSTTNHLKIGISHTGSGRFDGTIDEFRTYAVALTAEQIKRRYEQTKRDYVRGS